MGHHELSFIFRFVCVIWIYTGYFCDVGSSSATQAACGAGYTKSNCLDKKFILSVVICMFSSFLIFHGLPSDIFALLERSPLCSVLRGVCFDKSVSWHLSGGNIFHAAAWPSISFLTRFYGSTLINTLSTCDSLCAGVFGVVNWAEKHAFIQIYISFIRTHVMHVVLCFFPEQLVIIAHRDPLCLHKLYAPLGKLD